MTAVEAVELLKKHRPEIGTYPYSDDQYIRSCEVDEYNAPKIAALIEQQAQQLESIKALLPDKYSESKDWQASNTVNRIDWLKGMFEGKKLEIKQLEKSIEQQAQEIERMQTREHRMIEYMRDVKNFAFTINEVANNAIEEAEVPG